MLEPLDFLLHAAPPPDVLAGRLAEVFTQYLVYRGDWLADWERGGSTHADDSFQLDLWRELVVRVPGPHRAGLWQ